MWEKEKISKSLSVGLVALVFIFLSLQFVFFVAKVIEIRKYNRELVAEQSVTGADIPASGFDQKCARDVEKTAAASGNRQNRAREAGDVPDGGASASGAASSGAADSANAYSAAAPSDHVQSAASGSVARAFSLEKLPPRANYKPKPKVELNSADTTALMTLYGIGGYYARKIVEYRQRLGGSFVSPEQLMEIYGIDSARFVGFAERVYVDTSLIIPLDLYHMPADSMAKHPYIGKYAARGIDRYRRTVDSSSFTLDALLENGILKSAYVQRLKMYQKK